MSTPTITLVVVCDDHYVILLAALIKSAEQHLSKGAHIDLWIVEDGISAENKKKLTSSSNPAITTLHWERFDDVVKDTRLPKDRSSYPLNIYARLFIPDFIPPSVEKVLYLDVDMIVLADLAQLWDTDITGYYAAAVQDPRVKTFDNHWGGILNYQDLGLDGSTQYLNTGLLLINTRKWREDGITAKAFDIILSNLKHANYPDQYGLNIAMAGRWLPLDRRWNNFVTDEIADPYIIHFVGRKPIYKAYKYSYTFRDFFYTYLKNTAWHDATPIGEYERGIKKIKNILSKILPGKK